ncbi:MAG: carbonic anhydrase [archaeon]
MVCIKEIFTGNIQHTETVTEHFYTPHLSGQSPALCVIYCSDSRENIHIISNLEPKMGEIFTIENAGNIIDGSTSAIGSITYCLAHLKTKELLIIGHTSCGAIKAVFQPYEKDHKEIADHIRCLENVKKITLHTISKMEGKNITVQDIIASDRYLANASEINVDYQCEFMKALLKKQGIEGIKIYGAIHDLNGIYGKKNGALIMTNESVPAQVPSSRKSKLADYGKERSIKDLIEELNIAFFSTHI